jgi:hypothetical protein
MFENWQVALFLVFVVLPAAHAYEVCIGRRNRSKYRHGWFCKYGCYLDPVGSVWIDRNHIHEERQRKLDASQNVMTRLL